MRLASFLLLLLIFFPLRLALTGTGPRDFVDMIRPTADAGLIVAAPADPATPGDDADEAALLETVALYPNTPNPFNPETEIAFDPPRTMPVSVAVYDIVGQPVTVLARGMVSAGHHAVIFDGHDLPPGTYFCKLSAPGVTQTRKMELLK